MPSKRQRTEVPLGPLRAWFIRTVPDGQITALAEEAGMSEKSLRRIRNGFDWHRDGTIREVKTVKIVTADRLLIAEGSSTLEELYPYDQYAAA